MILVCGGVAVGLVQRLSGVAAAAAALHRDGGPARPPNSTPSRPATRRSSRPSPASANLPARAATIGIATAMQESKLRNIDYGDRDSLGLFQQRPSQGWGTPKQIQDPVYASNAFFDVLVKIDGYQNLPITAVAQKVQTSAFPSAYADHEPQARILASALAGHSSAALNCVLSPVKAARQSPGNAGLTPRAAAARRRRRAGGRSERSRRGPGRRERAIQPGRPGGRPAGPGHWPSGPWPEPTDCPWCRSRWTASSGCVTNPMPAGRR